MYLVGYDVAGVHRYVFEPVRPVDVLGGSRLLERFAVEAAKVAARQGATVIYSAGGTGLFQVDGEKAAASLATKLTQTLQHLTADGARCTAAWVESSRDFRAGRRRLAAELRAERFRVALGSAPRVLLPRGTWPSGVCEACGREVRTASRRVGDRGEGIGPRCRARYQAAGGPVPTIAEILGGEGDDVPRGAVLAAVYVDADELGRRLAEVASPDDLRRFSERLTGFVRDAVGGARTALSPRPILEVAVGGDDALLFCDAAQVPELTGSVWERLAGASSDLGVRFSTGIVLGEPFLPLRLYFGAAEEALRAAKGRSHATGRSHVGIGALIAGPRGAAQDVLGGPVPQEAFLGSGGVWALVGRVRAIVPAQRAGLGDDLALPSREEAKLAVEHRALRDKGVAHALSGTRSLAAAHGLDHLALLRGVLALAGTGGAARERATGEVEQA